MQTPKKWSVYGYKWIFVFGLVLREVSLHLLEIQRNISQFFILGLVKFCIEYMPNQLSAYYYSKEYMT